MTVKHTSSERMRQLVDWSSALWAGLIAGMVFFLLCFFMVPYFAGGNGWMMVRLIASIVLGSDVLAPPATFDGAIFTVALVTHFSLSMSFSLTVAYVLHRGGLITGIAGGALFGFALYAINFYTLTLLFPWFFGYRSFPMILAHVLFGALCGGLYESFEVEEFESLPAEEEATA